MKESKTIIRIEHKSDGFGMFRSKLKDGDDNPSRVEVGDDEDDILFELGKRHNDGFYTPFGDGLDMNLGFKEWFCAFKSIEQIQQWILPDEFKVLLDNDFQILLLTVTEYQEGNHQIIFTKESITSSQDISTLFL
jgi:hypothetical protein